jgi:hypothetical protein
MDVLQQQLPDPWAMPPRIWPSSSSGFITVPTSSTTL